jgi:hypothetical protein
MHPDIPAELSPPSGVAPPPGVGAGPAEHAVAGRPEERS